MIKITDIVALDEVSDDLNNGKSFYNQQEFGLGDYFWDNLIADIESLYLFAGIHNKKFGLYRMFSKRFPYAIYYEIKGKIAIVVAILPMRRDPLWIEKKIKDRK